MNREILLSKASVSNAQLPQQQIPSITNRFDNSAQHLNTASSIGSDNVFDASFSELIKKVDKLSPVSAVAAAKRPFEGVDISVDMSHTERGRLQEYLDSKNQETSPAIPE